MCLRIIEEPEPRCATDLGSVTVNLSPVLCNTQCKSTFDCHSDITPFANVCLPCKKLALYFLYF